MDDTQVPPSHRTPVQGSASASSQSASDAHAPDSGLSSGQHSPFPQQTNPGAQKTLVKVHVPPSQRPPVQGSASASTQSASCWQVAGWAAQAETLVPAAIHPPTAAA